MKFVILIIASVLFAACNSNSGPVSQNSSSQNVPLRAEKLQDTAVHTTENQTPKPANSNGGGKFSASGDPIDVTEFNLAIKNAEIKLADVSASGLRKKPGFDDANKALAEAYFKRGFALTEARQYAAALGDYRSALKIAPDHEESKKWIDQIVSIYTMLKKEPPKPGEEPNPLPMPETPRQ